MKQSPQKLSGSSVNSKPSHANNSRKYLIKEYKTNTQAVNEKIANFIFEQRGFFIRYANGEFDNLLKKEERPKPRKMLTTLRVLMDHLVKDVRDLCEQEDSALEAQLQKNTSSPNLVEFEQLVFSKFIYQLFYKKSISYEDVSFSKKYHQVLQNILNQHEAFSFSLYVAFFDGEDSLSKTIRAFNNLSQESLPKLKILIGHLKMHRDFYISSQNRSVFLEFLKAVRSDDMFKEIRQSHDILKEMGEFSANLLAQFAKIETVDIYWSRRSLSENPYSCFIELLELKPAAYEQYMPHFLLLNPHIANFLSAQTDKMELFADLWLQYKNSRKISHGRDMEMMVNSVIEHIFKNRDFYLMLASGKLDSLAENYPDKFAELKNCIIDLVEDLRLEKEKIKVDEKTSSGIYLFLLECLFHEKFHEAKEQLFTTSQAHRFKDFLYQHLHLVEMLYRHFCSVSEEDKEEGLSQIEELIMEARYFYMDSEETFKVFANHMNKNRKFYQTFFEELSLGCPSLQAVFRDKTVFSEVAKLFSAPEIFDNENDGFKAESPKRTLLDVLRMDEKHDVSQNITDFFLCNPSLANFFCHNYKLFEDAVTLYNKSVPVTLKRKSEYEGAGFWKKTIIDSKPTAQQTAQTAVNGFWERNQPKFSKQESNEVCKTTVTTEGSLESLADAVPGHLG